MTKNINHQGEIIAKLKKTITEQKKEIKRLEKKIEDSTLKLAEKGIKLDDLKQFDPSWKNDNLEQLNKRVKTILDNRHKTPYEKKISLFKVLEDLEVGNIAPEKKKRVNYLLQAHLYADLAKQSMKEYKKTTAEMFSKVE